MDPSQIAAAANAAPLPDDDDEDELKQMQLQLNQIHMQTAKAPLSSHSNPQRSGIEDHTQGDITVHHGNRKLKSSHYKSMKYMDFSQMSDILRAELLDGCDKMNYLHPSKIQAEAIPRCLSNNKELKYPNLIGQAHHGSGKTATFSLIMLQRVDENITLLQGLVVVHSRELAIQTFNVIRSLGQYIQGLKVGLAVPKEKLPVEWTQQIMIGTPGTMINKIFEHQKRHGDIKRFLKEFRILVVDEADEFLKSQQKPKGYRGRGRGRGRGGRGMTP